MFLEFSHKDPELPSHDSILRLCSHKGPLLSALASRRQAGTEAVMKPSVESLHAGAGELAPWLRGLAAVAEDQVLSTYDCLYLQLQGI